MSDEIIRLPPGYTIDSGLDAYGKSPNHVARGPSKLTVHLRTFEAAADACWKDYEAIVESPVSRTPTGIQCIFICDGCGKRGVGTSGSSSWHTPRSWFERGDDDGIQVACSRACIEKVAKESGKTDVVIQI